MVQSKKKCMYSNHLALKVKNIITMFINSIRRSMGLSKHQEHGMNVLGTFLLKCFRIGKTDSTLFTRKMGKYLFVCQIYIDDIIFGSTNKSFCDEFSKIMTDRFEMSMMGVLTFFLGFQIKQAKEGTFNSQTKYTRDILKKFGMDKAKPIKTPIGTNGHLDLDLDGTLVDQKVYHSMIESLLYLCSSRPDIMLSVCMYLVLTPKIGL
jgi:hypothetical protein